MIYQHTREAHDAGYGVLGYNMNPARMTWSIRGSLFVTDANIPTTRMTFNNVEVVVAKIDDIKKHGIVNGKE